MMENKLSKKQLRDIQDVAEILFKLENEVGLSNLKKNPIFEKLEGDMENVEKLVKELFAKDSSLRLSRDIFEELSITCNEKVIWKHGHGVIMQEVYNDSWLLRSAIHSYTEKHYSKKHHEIYLINDIVYQQFLIHCYENRGLIYRLKLAFIAKRKKIINAFEEVFDYRSFQ